MAKEKAKNTVSPNPAQIDWPRDVDGVTSELKKAITNAARRMNGRADKRDVILAVLEVGIGHVNARHDSQQVANAETVKWRAEQEAAANELYQPQGYRTR